MSPTFDHSNQGQPGRQSDSRSAKPQIEPRSAKSRAASIDDLVDELLALRERPVAANQSSDLYGELSAKLREIDARLAPFWSDQSAYHQKHRSDALAVYRVRQPIIFTSFFGKQARILCGLHDGTILSPPDPATSPFSQPDHGPPHRILGAQCSDECLRLTSGDIKALTYSPGGHRIAAGTAEGYLTLVNLDRESNSLRACEDYVRRSISGIASLAFSSGGELLASGQDNGELEIFKVNSLPRGLSRVLADTFGQGALRPENTLRLSGAIRGLSFSNDAAALAVAWGRNEISLFSVQREGNIGPQPLTTFRLSARNRATSSTDLKLSLSSCGRFLAAAAPGGILEIHDMRAIQSTGSPRTLALFEAEEVRALAFNPAGNMLAAGDRDTMRTFRLDESKEPGAGRWFEAFSFCADGPPESIAFSADGRQLLLATGRGELFVFC